MAILDAEIASDSPAFFTEPFKSVEDASAGVVKSLVASLEFVVVVDLVSMDTLGGGSPSIVLSVGFQLDLLVGAIGLRFVLSPTESWLVAPVSVPVVSNELKPTFFTDEGVGIELLWMTMVVRWSPLRWRRWL